MLGGISLLSFFVTLVVILVVCWIVYLILRSSGLPAYIQQVIQAIIGLFIVLWLLEVVFGHGSRYVINF